MNANDVIESYVADVAVRLPRKQRDDVAFELRALLNEELQGKAAGRDVDAAMALELVRAFGRPAEVAARYGPTLTIIDPADGPAFLRASIIGLAIIWGLGLWAHFRQPVDSVSTFVTSLGQWWGTTLIPSLWWPGALVVGFGLAAWSRRRWPQASDWKPRALESARWSRVGLAMGLVGIFAGLFVLIDPRRVLDAFFGGRMAPAAYDALTYTETFRHRQAPWLLALILLNIPLMICRITSPRWSSMMRRIMDWLSLPTCALLVWTIVDGPVFLSPISDRVFKGVLVMIVALTLVPLGVAFLRRVRPAPNAELRSRP
jgi:hypothetical protein